MNRSKISLGSKGSNGSNGSNGSGRRVQRDQRDQPVTREPDVSPIFSKRDKISLMGGSGKPVTREPDVQIDQSGPLGPTGMRGRAVSPIFSKRDKISLMGGSGKPRRAPGGRETRLKSEAGRRLLYALVTKSRIKRI